ncbi:MAG: hypothetical protein A2Z20_02525 [Bdellovibrionales bacterium RBG_16_40_8]|nr:MAG: hypothetical protein A2Z20_02525 [Bdellovibrionales bacterium RBG_16_40_8]
MKHNFNLKISLTLSLIISLMLPYGAMGDTTTDKEIVGVFAQAYLQEQIKSQIANFLDNNPQVVSSVNPYVGTEAMKFLGKIIAAYSLLTAKTDKDRAWAASHLILSPEPTTALIMVAVQIADTIVTLKQQRNLMKIYERIDAINADTMRNMRNILTYKYNHRIQYVQNFMTTMYEINLAYKDIGKFIGLEKSDELRRDLLESQVELLLDLLFKMQDLFVQLDMDLYHLETWVDIEEFNQAMPTEYQAPSLNKLKQLSAGFQNSSLAIERLRDSVFQLFFSVKGEEFVRQPREKLSEYRKELRIYARCASVVNRYKMSHVLDINNEVEASDLVPSCREKYNEIFK